MEDASLSWPSTRISISYFPYGGFPSQSRPDVDRPFGFKVISQLIQLRSQRNSSKTRRDWLDEEQEKEGRTREFRPVSLPDGAIPSILVITCVLFRTINVHVISISIYLMITRGIARQITRARSTILRFIH